MARRWRRSAAALWQKELRTGNKLSPKGRKLRVSRELADGERGQGERGEELNPRDEGGGSRGWSLAPKTQSRGQSHRARRDPLNPGPARSQGPALSGSVSSSPPGPPARAPAYSAAKLALPYPPPLSLSSPAPPPPRLLLAPPPLPAAAPSRPSPPSRLSDSSPSGSRPGTSTEGSHSLWRGKAGRLPSGRGGGGAMRAAAGLDGHAGALGGFRQV